MDALPFAQGEFDVIWSEEAIYNIGFEAGVSAWSHFLKPGGKLVVSEITWLTTTRPAAIQSHGEIEYPEIDVASAKIGILERHGYSPEAYFVLPVHCWLENYYRPMQGRFDAFLERHDGSDGAKSVVEAERLEIALYEKYRDYYSYGVYVAKKNRGLTPQGKDCLPQGIDPAPVIRSESNPARSLGPIYHQLKRRGLY